MIQLRKNVFETNSSSMHSLVVTKPEKAKEYCERELKFEFALNEDRKTKELSFNLWAYCDDEDLVYERSPFRILRTPLEKLRYYSAATLMNCEGKPDRKKEKEIKDFISKVTGITDYSKIILYHKEEHRNWKTGRIKTFKNYGSVYCNDSGETPMHFIKRKGISLEDLVMNPQYTIIVDGDEYCLFKALFEAGIIDANDFEDISTSKDYWNDPISECSYYFYRNNEDDIEDIVSDVLNYQHTFKLNLDPFSDLDRFPYDEEAIKILITAIRTKRPDIKVVLNLYTYTTRDITKFKPDWDTSIFDEVEYEEREEDNE